MEFVRSQFPAFSEPNFKDHAFFENAGGSLPCKQVIDRLTRFYRERKVQPYGPYTPALQGGAEMDEARARLARLLNVDDDELHIGPSTTQNVYVLAQAFGEFLKPGDAIVVTNQDHEANSGAWRRLERFGIEVREWQIDRQTGHLDTDLLDGLLDGAKLLCFPHCSNVVGEINDVAAICAKARAAGVYTCVDGVSYAPHGLPDARALGADIYMFSAYKTYGPHQGVMTIRRALAQELPAQGHFFNADKLTAKFTPAGPDHAQVAALAGIADYYDALAAHHGITGTPAEQAVRIHDMFQSYEQTLLQPLLDYVSAKNSMRLLGSADARRRALTVALELAGPGNDTAQALFEHGIMTAGSDFYAVRPLHNMGVDLQKGVLRLSFVHYTRESEVTRLIDALEQVI